MYQSEFRVLDAARQVADDVNALIAREGRRLIDPLQLQGAVNSIAANIREAYGRRIGPERNMFLRIARSSSEDTDEHLRGNCSAGRIPERQFYRQHNRLRIIVRMRNRLMSP